jgi:flagellar protein FlaG
MVTVTNKNTGEVVRQVPADAILKVAHNMEALKGVIFDEMF